MLPNNSNISWCSIAAGIIGIFLPIMPTSPSSCSPPSVSRKATSEVRFHTWLVEHKQFGPLVRDYLLSGTVPLKIAALTMIWIFFPVPAFFLVEALWLKLLLISAPLLSRSISSTIPPLPASSRWQR